MPRASHLSPSGLAPSAWSICLLMLSLLAMVQGCLKAEASNPRWTTGPPYFTVQGSPVLWYTTSPLYYTDPGDLSASVNHAAADTMVAAAASVWNVPTSMMVLQQGGLLSEQVSGANVYLGSGGLVFPADVQSSNYASKQIAVIYDRDGSVTDLLLGGGASDPSSCLQNAVTESVDSIARNGFIQHALLILNGRCTGAAPEKQLQMQYQLERAFGRVLGLGWSQLNDNVFMGTPQPTYSQALHWPIMHPIDVICGVYTYQCMPQPFTLRDDDIASISYLYPVSTSNVPAGKQPIHARASALGGNIRFPNQEGMGGVNIIVRRNSVPQQVMDNFDDVSTVTGNYAQQVGGNPVTPKPSTFAASLGETSPYYDVAGYYDMEYVPIPDGQGGQDILMHTEPINPLYIGEYAIAPYPLSTVSPSGDSVTWRFNYVTPNWGTYYEPPVYNAASSCSTSSDGTESSPTPTPVSGWWNNVICGSNPSSPWTFGHTSWVSLPVRANRSLTVEMTALDGSGYSTGSKVRPVVGVWSAADPIGSRPSLASAPIAFNSVVLGLSTATAQVTQADTLRLAFTSETGDGRSDYNYQARVLYADTAAPAGGSAGTPITISGRGFRPGNTVTFNGVNASVTGWTSTTILATVPRLTSVLPGATATADIRVTDLSTHGTTVMGGVFLYSFTPPTYVLKLISAPASPQIVSLPAPPDFTVKVIDVDGVTVLPNTPVVFSAITGTVAFGGCATATCTVLTDSNGLASIPTTPLSSGTVTLQAAAFGQTQQVSFQVVPLIRTATASPQYKYLAAGAVANWMTNASFTQQGQPAAQVPVVWVSSANNLSVSAAQTVTSSTGTVQANIQGGPINAGSQVTGTVCAWGNVCATFTAIGVDLSQLQVIPIANGAQIITGAAGFAPVTLLITDAQGNPVSGATVHIHQATRQWITPCTGKGRCPEAPISQTTDTVILSDSNGNLSVVPLDMGGAEVTSLVVACGNQGYTTLTLQRHP